ncbi:MAG: amidohydrolase family protein [Flavobacteriaceae bacterium]|nr:amidohydrolase family protein [Bacteroidia bacterium]NNK88622.1 amidohydrolase family protein [Flavobacteriaceae bacterium]
MKHLQHIILVFLVGMVGAFAQQTPAPEQTEAYTIIGATAHIGNGEVIENSLIIIKDGKILACVDALTSKMAMQGEIIKAQGKHVYPGIIAPNSTLGLQEIGAVRATNDTREIGDMNPNIRSIIAYNAESKIVESMRPNGVLIGQITPRGGTISGSSSIVQFDAWNWEDAAIKTDEGIHMNWPNTFTRGRWWLGEDPGLKPNKNYKKNVDKANMFVAESKAYLAGDRSTMNLKYEAMSGLFDGSKTLYVHVDDERGLRDAIDFKDKNGIAKMVIVGGYQAPKVAELLKQHDIPVLVQRTHTTPAIDDHDYDYTFKLPKLLVDAGVLVGLQNSGSMERANARNLPFQAGTVAAYGMDKEEALKLITSNSAKILGIDDRLGTLEAGKDATFFVSEGDALDMRTNKLTHAFINGRAISLESHQTELWKRYADKYGQKN